MPFKLIFLVQNLAWSHDKGVAGNLIFGIPDTDLTIHYRTS